MAGLRQMRRHLSERGGVLGRLPLLLGPSRKGFLGTITGTSTHYVSGSALFARDARSSNNLRDAVLQHLILCWILIEGRSKLWYYNLVFIALPARDTTVVFSSRLYNNPFCCGCIRCHACQVSRSPHQQALRSATTGINLSTPQGFVAGRQLRSSHLSRWRVCRAQGCGGARRGDWRCRRAVRRAGRQHHPSAQCGHGEGRGAGC